MIKTLKIVGISFLILLLIMAGLMLFINSSAGQKFVQKQLVSFLGNKIDTPYRIGSIKYRIPDWVVIEDIYFEDQQRDTLVMANSIRVDIDMLALIRSKIIVNSLVINKGLVKIYTPDDSEDFNYQFLADAFSSGEPEVAEPINQTSAENPFVLENVKLSDIRFYYLDKPGGMEFSAGLGNAAVVFNELNPGQNLYDISNVELQKGKLSFHSFPATVFKEDTIPATPLKINLGKVSLKEFDWKYNGEDIGIQNKVLADQADFDFEKIDLENQELVIKNAALDRSAIEVFFVQPTAVVIPAQEKESAGSWKIRLSNLDLERSAIHYRDALANPVLKPNEFNASDFKLTDANIKLKNFSFDETGLSGKVEKAEMKERSGLAIRRLDGYFLYSDQKMALNDFRLQTLLSDFDGDVNVSYPSLDAFVNDPVSARIDVKIRKGSIALKDVFRFNAGLLENKGLKENSGESIRFAGSLKGDKGNFVFNKIRVGIGKENVLAFNGFANGVTDLKKLKTRLEIEELKTSKNFYASFIPESVDLGGYQLPEEILVNGILDGNEQELKLEGRVITDLGEIALNGILKEVSSDSLRSYSGFLYTEELALNKFLGEELGVGKLTAGLNITADADFGDLAAEGTINKVEYNGYAYRDIVLNAIFKDSLLVLKGASGDPNALIDADFRSDLRANHLSVNGTLDLKNLALSELNLASLEQVIRGQFKLDLKLENSEYILGNARVQGFQLGETNAGDLEAVFTRKDDNQEIRLASGFVKADLKSIGGINRLQQYLSDFTAESTDSVQIIPDGGITLAGQLIGHPLWSELVPGLTLATPVIFGLESQNEYIDGEVSFEKITYTDFTLTDLAASLEGSRGKYSAQAELKDLDLNGYRLKKNILQVNYENDVLQAGLSIADSLGDDLHRLEFQITDVDEEQLISLKELTFDKQKFAVGENQIRVIDGSKLLTDALTLTSGAQVIRLEGNESRLSLSTENLQVAPFYRIVNGTAVKLEGLLNAKVDLNNNFSELSGEVKALLSDLEVDDEKIGDIELRIPQFTTEKIALEGKVTGPRSEAKYGGIISMEGDGNLNVRVELNKLDAALIKAFSVGQVKNAKGELYGELLVTGTFSQPRPDGSLGFRDFEVTPTYLGVPLHIDDQKIRFQDRSVIFRNFTMLDSLNQKLVFDGSVDWSNLEAISYRLSLNTSNFLLLDTQEQDNELVYGKLKLDANLRLAGVGEKPNIEGKVRVREGSDLTLVMPADIETAETQGLVYFVPPKDSLLKESVSGQDSLKTTEALTEVINEILIEVETDENAQFTIIVDEINNDRLVFSGTSNLTIGLYPNGQQYIIGNFDLTKGLYSFSLEVFKREFSVVKGSRLTWNGDPFKATMDITALYEVHTDIQSLTAFGLNSTSYGKVPINVLLKMTGSIEEPVVTFDLEVSDKAENSIKSLIESYNVFASLKQNPSEMNQQVFSLILFNRFMSDQLLSFSGGGLSGESMARQSVSKLLTEQLNMLAGNLLGNVGLSLGLDSDVMNSSQGRASRTEFNVGLNKNFLNDRIRISLGKNFELANTTGVNQNSTEVFDKINIEYLVTPDGRYVVKVYRDNEFQTVLEGFVIETGIGFELRANYDKFGEIFKKRGTK